MEKVKSIMEQINDLTDKEYNILTSILFSSDREKCGLLLKDNNNNPVAGSIVVSPEDAMGIYSIQPSLFKNLDNECRDTILDALSKEKKYSEIEALVKENRYFIGIKYIPTQSKELIWKALRSNTSLLVYVKEPTDDMIQYMLEDDWATVDYSEDIEEACLKIIETHPEFINKIMNYTDDFKSKAIAANPAVQRQMKIKSTEERSM